MENGEHLTTLTCPICQVSSSARCSNCLKVVYCGKEHQKQHRKLHKKECFPALIKSHATLGQHLAASRDIKGGEVIFHEEPLVLGPRSNLPEFHKICLGCCAQVSGSYSCAKCRWPLCGAQCENKPWHANFECQILSRNKVPPAKTQEEYLCITFLRGLLLKHIDPERWHQLLKFESHANSRNTVSLTLKQSQDAFKFITEKCGLKEFDKATVDFVYGIILVNGYGDSSTFAVKLYSKAGKLSHACIPNTRTRVLPNGLDVIAAVSIKSGQPLTQLYGRMLKGTHRRQELLQHVYYFTCSCSRCKDPTEFSTYFSALKCPSKKCSGGYLLPKNPLKLDGNPKWECDNCGFNTTSAKSVIPALGTILKETGMDDDSTLFTEYEIYMGDGSTVPDDETVALAQLQTVLEMREKLERLEGSLVHKNHYALLPLKTACIATCHSLLQKLGKFDQNMFHKVLQMYGMMTTEILNVINVFLPGVTSERGILLFHLSERIRLEIQNEMETKSGNKDIEKRLKELDSLQKECLKIMELESDEDSHKILVFEYLNGKNLASYMK
ncbi:unnamed protein product [Orchesella dallaii]|uniref:MYND-type domain-containing protein n=1 Tax=Orchesella dallaii TaxID=48710 RepID=A0ABP1PY84_9HEXA